MAKNTYNSIVAAALIRIANQADPSAIAAMIQKIHAADMPDYDDCKIIYKADRIESKVYTLAGISHRTSGPATILYHRGSDRIESEHYRINGELHRTDGPAWITYFDTMVHSPRCVEFYIDGKLHRDDGPARTWYYHSGFIEVADYFQNNRWHRVDGPARLEYNSYGMLIYETYALNNLNLTFPASEAVCKMRTSTNKTETLVEILKTFEYFEYKTQLAQLLPKMFKNELDQNVVNNLELFI